MNFDLIEVMAATRETLRFESWQRCWRCEGGRYEIVGQRLTCHRCQASYITDRAVTATAARPLRCDRCEQNRWWINRAGPTCAICAWRVSWTLDSVHLVAGAAELVEWQRDGFLNEGAPTHQMLAGQPPAKTKQAAENSARYDERKLQRGRDPLIDYRREKSPNMFAIERAFLFKEKHLTDSSRSAIIKAGLRQEKQES